MLLKIFTRHKSHEFLSQGKGSSQFTERMFVLLKGDDFKAYNHGIEALNWVVLWQRSPLGQ